MRRFIPGFVAVLMLIGLGCATMSVTYDYDPEADFSGLKTYAWQPIPKKAKGNEFIIKRVRSAVEGDLSAKGYVMNDASPDFFIAIHGGKERKVDVQEWGYVYGPRSYYRNYPYPDGRFGPEHRPRPGFAGNDIVEYRSGTDVYEYEEGTLIIDIVNAGDKVLLWRGMATDVIDPTASPEERTKKINEIVTTILANFPPGQGTSK